MPDRLDAGLHPPLEPSRGGHLAVGQGHAIWWEEAGTPTATPLLILHGGPGGAIKPYYRRLADPARARLVLFEQRGCGRSTPSGERAENTTMHLVADIERLRESLGIERWVVLGGSWGSTLALAYAQAHPGRVRGLALSGVFLARSIDIDWWWSGVRHIHPEVWHELRDFLPEDERLDVRASYLARISNPDPAIHTPAVAAMLRYEVQALDALPNPVRLANLVSSPTLTAMGRLHAHYEQNRYFLRENELLDGAHRLAGIPGAIVAGRHDAITPPLGAWELARAWPDARLAIVPLAGHAWDDPLLAATLVPALDRLI